MKKAFSKNVILGSFLATAAMVSISGAAQAGIDYGSNLTCEATSYVLPTSIPSVLSVEFGYTGNHDGVSVQYYNQTNVTGVRAADETIIQYATELCSQTAKLSLPCATAHVNIDSPLQLDPLSTGAGGSVANEITVQCN